MHIGSFIYRSILTVLLLGIGLTLKSQDNFITREGTLAVSGVVNGEEVISKSNKVQVNLDSPSHTLSIKIDGATVTRLDGSTTSYSEKYPTEYSWFTTSIDLFEMLKSHETTFTMRLPMTVSMNYTQQTEEVEIVAKRIRGATGNAWQLEISGYINPEYYSLNKVDFRFDEDLYYTVRAYVSLRMN